MGYALPGGGLGFVCSKRDYMPGGEEFIGIGIQPDVKVDYTLSGIREGRDEVLEAAIKYFR
jgi:C-terminal processing protease CtpA/Prc